MNAPDHDEPIDPLKIEDFNRVLRNVLRPGKAKKTTPIDERTKAKRKRLNRRRRRIARIQRRRSR